MVYEYFDRFTFLCEMYLTEHNKIEELILHYYPYDSSVQVTNVRKSKITLTRTQLPSVTIDMLKIGNIINVYGKMLLITACSPPTRDKIFKNVESTFVLIKPLPPGLHAKVINFIVEKGFRIVQMKNGRASKEFVEAMYLEDSGNPHMPLIMNYITSGEVIGLELEATDAVSKWHDCVGATVPADAAPGTLRKLYGTDILRNVAHGSFNLNDAKRMIDLYFGFENGFPRIKYQATYKDCTCCVIKPHAMIDGNIGKILETINDTGKFVVTAMAMFSMKYVNALEFYEIYKGVLPEYERMAKHLAGGKCVALEIKMADKNHPGNVVEEFRKLCGPRDVSVCQQLYPNSIRAKYGIDPIYNAVHCTDLPEDGELEVEYFFKLLASETYNDL